MSLYDYKVYDKAGSVWKLDKQKRKFFREKISTILDKLWKQGFYTKYSKGDIVCFDNGIKIVQAEIVDVLKDEYKIKVGNEIISTTEDNLFSMEEIYGQNI